MTERPYPRVVHVARHERLARVVQVLEDGYRWRGLFYVAPGVGGLSIAVYNVNPETEMHVTYEPVSGDGDRALCEEDCR